MMNRPKDYGLISRSEPIQLRKVASDGLIFMGSVHFVSQQRRSPLVTVAITKHYCQHSRVQDVQAMSEDDKLIDLSAERAKRTHDLNDKRLNEVRQAFEQALPMGKGKKKPKGKPKKP